VGVRGYISYMLTEDRQSVVTIMHHDYSQVKDLTTTHSVGFLRTGQGNPALSNIASAWSASPEKQMSRPIEELSSLS
jgi:hypothetical protein